MELESVLLWYHKSSYSSDSPPVKVNRCILKLDYYEAQEKTLLYPSII